MGFPRPFGERVRGVGLNLLSPLFYPLPGEPPLSILPLESPLFPSSPLRGEDKGEGEKVGLRGCPFNF